MTRLVALTSTGQVSGAERVLVRTLAAAVAAGWDVVCVCPEGPLAGEVAATGARHVAIPSTNLAPGRRLPAALRTLTHWVRAARTLRRVARGADVVVANALLALPVLRLARVGAPAVWLAHDVVVAPARLRLYGWCRPALARVVGVSEAVARPLRDGRGPRVDVVHNGVAFPVAPRRARPDADDALPVVGLNGLLTPWKGQHVLLDAAWMLGVPARIEIMGGHLPTDADYAARVRTRVDGTRLGERVSVIGHQSDPLERMRGWTVAVSASTDPEACPLGVLEAMSIGVPVVATDHGGAPEVLAGAGELVRPGDARELAAAITRLLRQPALRRRRADAGRERVAAAHRLDHQTTRLLDVLSEVAREAREAREGSAL